MGYFISSLEKDLICEKWGTTKLNATEIGKEFGFSNTAINKTIKERGFSARKMSDVKRKYDLDESFFDIIDTEQKAYILGFLYADGYNNQKQGKVIISLKESDIELLEKINNTIQPNKPIKEISFEFNRKKGMKTSDQQRMVICSRKISDALSKLGCPQAKTFILEFPTEDQVPSTLHRHFIRGYFDGDGSIGRYGTKSTSCFIGTESLLLGIQKILAPIIGSGDQKLHNRHPERNTPIRSLVYCGTFSCIKLREWMYEGATIFMKRKKAKFDLCIPYIRTPNKCSIEGCENIYCKKGYCRKHHNEFIRNPQERLKRQLKNI
jgi:hypothetical protein